MNWRELIKKRLDVLEMTQEQLAEHLDMTQGGLGHWLNGKRQPPFEKLIQIADVLRLDRAELGAALLDAHVGARAEVEQRQPRRVKSAGTKLANAEQVDLDLLQQILENQDELRADFNNVLREIRAGRQSAVAESEAFEKQKHHGE